MTVSPRSLVPALAAGFGLSLLSGLPAGAHDLAAGDLLTGGLHPLLGMDHLLLLVGVGAAAAGIDGAVLLFALAGALLGGCFGALDFGALSGALPLAEVLAALAVSAVGLLLLRPQGWDRRLGLALPGGVIAAAVALHALLHGQAATGELGWWLGGRGQFRRGGAGLDGLLQRPGQPLAVTAGGGPGAGWRCAGPGAAGVKTGDWRRRS